MLCSGNYTNENSSVSNFCDKDSNFSGVSLFKRALTLRNVCSCRSRSNTTCGSFKAIEGGHEYVRASECVRHAQLEDVHDEGRSAELLFLLLCHWNPTLVSTRYNGLSDNIHDEGRSAEQFSCSDGH